VLIDWEYARLGDAADELAYLFTESSLDASCRHALLRGYRGVIGEERCRAVAARIEAWEPLTLLGSAMWWFERYQWRTDADQAGRADPSVPRPAEHYLQNATKRLDRFELAG
jgi:thiamine kinase-like enzyme